MAKVRGVSDLQRQLDKTLKSTASPEQIRNVAHYLQRALHNAPNHRPPKKKKKLDAQNKVYFPNPHGGNVYSGMTVSEYLKVIKGGYRAVGNSYRNVRKYGRPDRQSVGVRPFPWAEVDKVKETKGTDAARKLAERLSRKTALRGTGKVGKAEYEKLEKLAKKRAEILKKSTSSIRSLEYSIKAVEEVRKAEIKADAKLKISRKERDKKRKKHSEKVTEMKRRLRMKKEIQRVKNQDRAAAFEEKNRRYRIVVPSSRGGYVTEMMPQTLVTPGAKPGKPPYTRERPGFYNKYIARKWRVVPDGKGYKLVLSPGPDMPETSGFLKRLEYGGNEKNTPIIIGYMVEFRDEDARGRRFKHRRIAIRPLLCKPGTSYQPAHPFVRPTVSKVQKQLKTRNGARTILNYGG